MIEIGETDEASARRYFLAESNMRIRGHAFALTQRIDWQAGRIAHLEAALRFWLPDDIIDAGNRGSERWAADRALLTSAETEGK